MMFTRISSGFPLFLPLLVRHRLLRPSIFLLSITLPLFVGAATVAETLVTPDDDGVTRGEFVRSAVTVLGIPQKVEAPLPFKRVPKALIPYVSPAHRKGALSPFGSDLMLSRSITRGEALIVLMKLQGLKPVGVSLRFVDAPEGSDLEKAVQIAVEKDWMRPLRPSFFGADRVLTGREGRLLLRKAIGETIVTPRSKSGQEPSVPSVVIRFKTRERPQLPNDELLRTIWQLLNTQFLYTDRISEEEAAYSAAEALVNSLKEPYTTFLRPLPAKELQTQIEGEVSGIGAQVEMKDEILTVVAPLTGSPAEKAGLKAGDQILSVDGQSLKGVGFMESVAKVRGPKGSNVILGIRRDGTEMNITVMRDLIQVPEIIITKQQNVTIVKIVQFGNKTDRELRSIMAEIEEERPRGIIIDLRNNPGGLLHAADVVVSNFLPHGSTVARIKSRTDDYTEKTMDPPTISSDVPVVVLVNKGSASASEIVAGALQDAKRATIVGEKTFGKGTVQQIMEFLNGSGLKMTIAEWFTPAGRKIDGVGITPDVEVAASEDNRDVQLLKALDLIR